MNKKKFIPPTFKKARLLSLIIILVLGFSWLGLAGVTFLFIRTVYKQVEAQLFHKAERASFAVVQYYMNKIEVQAAFEVVKTAFLIDEEENLIFSLHQEVAEVALHKINKYLPLKQDLFIYPDFENKLLIVIRKMDEPQPENKPYIFLLPNRERKPSGAKSFFIPRENDYFLFRGSPFLKYLYLELEDSSYLFFLKAYYPLQIATQILLLAFILSVAFIFIKNLQYRTKLQQQNDFVILGQAASTLAHEMKNPLSAILIQTSLLKLKEVGELAKEEIHIIEEETNRLKKLSSTVGDLIRDPQGSPLEVDLVRPLYELCQKKDKRIFLKTEKPEIKIFFDPQRLELILENILNNALESGSPPEEIKVEIKEEKNKVIVTIYDAGSGLTEAPEVLFAPLFTTKPKGFGLGLPLVKRYLEASGGKISLKNRPEQKGSLAILEFKKFNKSLK